MNFETFEPKLNFNILLPIFHLKFFQFFRVLIFLRPKFKLVIFVSISHPASDSAQPLQSLPCCVPGNIYSALAILLLTYFSSRSYLAHTGAGKTLRVLSYQPYSNLFSLQMSVLRERSGHLGSHGHLLINSSPQHTAICCSYLTLCLSVATSSSPIP